MSIWKLRLIALFGFCINKFIPKQLLFRKTSSEDIYFAYIDPKQIIKTSYINEMSPLILGENAFYGAVSGLWGVLSYSFKDNIMYKLCCELMNNKKGKIYQYIVKRHSLKEAEHIWNKLINLRESFANEGYRSQYQLNTVSRKLSVGRYNLPRNETYIVLNKNGEFIRLFSGRHRLALAQQMGIKEIPVIITCHHPKAKQFLPIKSRVITGKDSDYRPFD